MGGGADPPAICCCMHQAVWLSPAVVIPRWLSFAGHASFARTIWSVRTYHNIIKKRKKYIVVSD